MHAVLRTNPPTPKPRRVQDDTLKRAISIRSEQLQRARASLRKVEGHPDGESWHPDNGPKTEVFFTYSDDDDNVGAGHAATSSHAQNDSARAAYTAGYASPKDLKGEGSRQNIPTVMRRSSKRFVTSPRVAAVVVVVDVAAVAVAAAVAVVE
jgi:hypothetical protein